LLGAIFVEQMETVSCPFAFHGREAFGPRKSALSRCPVLGSDTWTGIDLSYPSEPEGGEFVIEGNPTAELHLYVAQVPNLLDQGSRCAGSIVEAILKGD